LLVKVQEENLVKLREGSSVNMLVSQAPRRSE
jgi:hypothetical protein